MNQKYVNNTIFLKLIIILFIMIGSFSTLTAQEKKRIAILDFSAKNIAETYAESIREIIEVALYKTDTFDILERKQINLIIAEQNLQQERCEDTSCSVKIGKLVSADIVIIGSIVKLDGFTITIRYVDISKGQIFLADSETVIDEKEIKSAINILSNRTAKTVSEKLKSIKISKPAVEKVEPKSAPVEKKVQEKPLIPIIVKTGVYYIFGTIPGFGQMFAGHRLKGGLLFTTFVLSGIGTIAGYKVYEKQKDQYHDLRGSDTSKYDKEYREYKIAANVTIYSGALCALIYLFNWIDILFITSPDFEKNNANYYPERKNYFLSMDILEEGSSQGLKISYTMRF